jgi:aminoglycoside phosphotransferase (APT) family kinase protein
MNTSEPFIVVSVALELVRSQFPSWSSLDVTPVEDEGWCNRAFRLGENMIMRLPRHQSYAAQVEKEAAWLPKLAPLLPTPIPEPVALGAPSAHYPLHWSVYRWIEGQTARPERVESMSTLARSLAAFLVALQRVPTQDGPAPGPHNFYRGGPLATYDSQTRSAIAAIGTKIDMTLATEAWDRALASRWQGMPVWIHGDVSVGNLLVKNGQLCAVIDFGNIGVGDPACDIAMYWTTFEGDAKKAFSDGLDLDRETWARGRGWVLWKALILASGLAVSNSFEAAKSWSVIHDVLADHRRTDA